MTGHIVAIPSREDLLGRVGEGDQAAFGALYDQICPRVLGVIQRCLVDFSQSEEVAQEVFLEIWQTASRFEPRRGSALAWILTIAHRRAVDRVRTSQATRNRDLRSGIRHTDIPFDHVWENIEVRLEHERATRAMAKLSRLQRQAIALTYFDGYTQGELATLLGISIGTAKTRVRDGLISLRNEMGAA